jgi:hypothetical protein
MQPKFGVPRIHLHNYNQADRGLMTLLFMTGSILWQNWSRSHQQEDLATFGDTKRMWI